MASRPLHHAARPILSDPGGIYQILALLQDREELTTQRWTVTSVNPTCPHPLQIAGHPTISSTGPGNSGYLRRRRPLQNSGHRLTPALAHPLYQDPHHPVIGDPVFYATYGFLAMARPGLHPPLGNLRLMLSNHRTLAYRSNRDSLRSLRGAPPIWLASHRPIGKMSDPQHAQPLRSRMHTLRTLWDLR